MHCSKCGEPIQPDESFCKRCGASNPSHDIETEIDNLISEEPIRIESRYPALRTIAVLYKIAAVIIGIVALGCDNGR